MREKITITEPNEIIKMIKKFKLKSGHRPAFILTTEDKRKAIAELFGYAPKKSVKYSIADIPIVTILDVMIV